LTGLIGQMKNKDSLDFVRVALAFIVGHGLNGFARIKKTFSILDFNLWKVAIDIFSVQGSYSTAPNNSKYFSLLIPIIRMLFLITNVGTSLYFGITTGRIAPG
jgi:hypothetical protein